MPGAMDHREASTPDRILDLLSDGCGERTSWSPQTSSVGTRIAGSRSRVSAWANAVAIRRNPLGWKPDMIRASLD